MKGRLGKYNLGMTRGQGERGREKSVIAGNKWTDSFASQLCKVEILGRQEENFGFRGRKKVMCIYYMVVIQSREQRKRTQTHTYICLHTEKVQDQ